MTFCSKCGYELSADAKFCPNCGKSVSEGATINLVPNNDELLPIILPAKDTLENRLKRKMFAMWNNMDFFVKSVLIAMVAAVFLLLLSVLTHTEMATFISMAQLVGLIVAVLIHKGIIKNQNAYIKYIVLILAILFSGLNIISYSWKGENASSVQGKQPLPIQSIPTTSNQVNQNLSIVKGSEYAYMNDKWNVYIAEAISDSLIKIEKWSKENSDAKSVKYEEDVGTYRINDADTGFAWLDGEQMAFEFVLQDKGNSRLKTAKSTVFTINISDSDKYKGSNYDDKISCYSFQNDDWHLYRAIPLTENLVKIECWHRGHSFGNFIFGYDVCVIDVYKGNTDFEWTDESHTAFTITMWDPENGSNWEGENFVAFTLENDTYTYTDVKSYLDSRNRPVGEDEAAMPGTVSSYRNGNYQAVQEKLISAGFTNITTEIEYDIVWGWTSEGEVESVSVGGRTDYEQGEIFKKDVEIVITYHMKYEDDPARQMQESPVQSETPVRPTEKLPEQTEEPAKESKIPDSVSYSTNSKDKVKNGNAGVYAYEGSGNSVYYIINFDDGYVYRFLDDESTTCERVKIDSGTLNDVVIITYHDGGTTWSEGLHFKWKRQPDHLILEDNDHFEWDFYPTNLEDALAIRDKKTIKDY